MNRFRRPSPAGLVAGAPYGGRGGTFGSGGRGHRDGHFGLQPNLLATVLNGLWAKLASAGLGAGRLVTLEVPGRTTGRPISLPVVPVTVDGQRYLVSMLGDNVGWVRNVRAAGGRAVLCHGDREEVRLEEVPPALRAPILKAYLQRAPGARPHIPVDKDAPLSEFERVAAALPAFRVLSRDPSSRGSVMDPTRSGY